MWYYIDHFVTSCHLGNCKTRILLELDKYLLSLSWMSAIYWHSKDKPIWSGGMAKCLILRFCESSIGWYFITVKIFTYYLSIICNQINVMFVFKEHIFKLYSYSSSLTCLSNFFNLEFKNQILVFLLRRNKISCQKNYCSNKLFMLNP